MGLPSGWLWKEEMVPGRDTWPIPKLLPCYSFPQLKHFTPHPTPTTLQSLGNRSGCDVADGKELIWPGKITVKPFPLDRVSEAGV